MILRANDQIVHKAAWLYYTHNLRQDEVARRLNISRASVATYLRKARETGIVSIAASTQLFSDDILARRLEDALGLDAVWVVTEDRQALDPATEIPVVAASAFLELVQSGSRIGVAWGRTVYHIADVMSYADVQDATVLQLCGNLGAPYNYRPDQCTMEIARRLNAQGINLYAPLILSSESLAADIRSEPVIAEQLAAISACDLALYSVGSVDKDSHIVRCGALTADELAALGEEGATGVIGGQLIDADGQLMDCAYNRRLISADLDAVRAIPRRIMVVAEDSKFDALAAAIRGGFVSHLVVTASMARRLLDLWDTQSQTTP
ncbi:sugar-binding transcriptional regulator [Pelagibacterium montanilacus]|uniref:sugar-binding transcriptional regulator n=1 Tax=Pelagibacterium montanilacus TaxID=2185280 RepID=UPI000F8D4A7B|nr:sugar-binding transcriptional regulator [Pelagibacterium montanilacus]